MSDLDNRLDEVKGRISALKEELVAYYDARNALRYGIMRTYPCGQITVNGWPRLVVLEWTRDGAEARFARFPQLDEFNREWAPTTNEMRGLKAEARSLKQAIDAEQKAMAKAARTHECQ